MQNVFQLNLVHLSFASSIDFYEYKTQAFYLLHAQCFFRVVRLFLWQNHYQRSSSFALFTREQTRSSATIAEIFFFYYSELLPSLPEKGLGISLSKALQNRNAVNCRRRPCRRLHRVTIGLRGIIILSGTVVQAVWSVGLVRGPRLATADSVGLQKATVITAYDKTRVYLCVYIYIYRTTVACCCLYLRNVEKGGKG